MLDGTGVRKISSVACGFSSIKMHFPYYLKSLISRVSEVYVFFNKISLQQYFIEKKHTSFITVCFAAITLVSSPEPKAHEGANLTRAKGSWMS